MKLFRSVGILGSFVLVGIASLAGCSTAARDASNSNSVPVVQNITLTANTNPVIAGTPLFASYTYFDTNNDAEATGGSSIQWLRNGATITGATGRLYTLTLADAGKTISAEVTPLAQTGSSPGLPVSNSVTIQPANVALNVSPGLKQLRFSWAAVPGASSYRVSTNLDGVSAFVPLSAANVTGTTYDWHIPVHRINWPKAQFLLEACDASNTCLQSASISALDVMVSTIGYFKASNAGTHYAFGASVALSGDGLTLAVGAVLEDSAAIGGNQLNDCAATSPANCARDSGAVYVFTRSSGAWTQQAYVKASNTGVGDQFGGSVALSADGNTLAVGANGEDSAKIGVILGAPAEAATPNDALGADSGAVYVFTRSGDAWTQQAYVKASNTWNTDWFGYSVALSGDGLTLAVGANGEDSAKIGVILGAPAEAATPHDALGIDSGAVYVFTRSGGAWTQQAYVKASNTGASDYFGTSVALSGDGLTLAVGAEREDSAAIGDSQLDDCGVGRPANCARDSGAVYVFTRSGDAWSQQAYVKASNIGAEDLFGVSVALSGDGLTLAVGADSENNAKTVILGAPDSGAVYLFSRSGGAWTQQAYVKASNTGASDYFGNSVALSSDGLTLAVGAIFEDSAKAGVIPGAPVETDTPDSALATDSGAVYLFTRSGDAWTQQAYVKALNPRAGNYATATSDRFGGSVALSADGSTLAVGANGEASAATGVNNTIPGQSDNSAPVAGAVYLY